MHGLVRLDLESLEVTQALELDEAVSAVLRRDGTLALLQRDGTIDLIDRDGATTTVPAALWEVPADTTDWYEFDE